jgi:hypothetical protein
LAGPTGNDPLGNNSSVSQDGCIKGADVFEDWDIGPVFPEDFAGVFFDFAEGDGAETACAL